MAVLVLLACGVVPALGNMCGCRRHAIRTRRPPASSVCPALRSFSICRCWRPLALAAPSIRSGCKADAATLEGGSESGGDASVQHGARGRRLGSRRDRSGGAPGSAPRCAVSRTRIPTTAGVTIAFRGRWMSEHGRANALDIGGLRLGDGRLIRLTDVDVSAEWRTAVRTSACTRFNTVLGPGSDGYHEEHIHLDLAERRLAVTKCASGQSASRFAKPWPRQRNPEPAPWAGSAVAKIADPVPLPRRARRARRASPRSR